MTYTTTMTSKGQITVPAPIRKKLGLKPGAAVEVELKGNTAVVKANDWQQGLAEVRAEIAVHLKAKGIKRPRTDADFRRLREAAETAAALDRHKRYTRTLEE